MTNLINPGYFTELSAVNYVLRALGESPITSLPGTQADVQMILGHFNDIAAEVLAMEQWKFNTEIGYQLFPSGQIQYNNPFNADVETLNVFTVPSNLASWRTNPNYAQTGTNYVDLEMRQAVTFNTVNGFPLLFYDRIKNREGFNAQAYPFLALDVGWFFPFVNLPYQAQLYICAKTARRAVEQSVNSAEIAGFVKTDEAFAWRHLMRMYGKVDSYNALRTVNAFRRYGNRPATNVGFIDNRGLAPSIFPSVIAPAAVTVTPASAGPVFQAHNQSYSFVFTVTNPNALYVTVAITPYFTGSVSVASAQSSLALAPNASAPVTVNYTVSTTGAGTTGIQTTTTAVPQSLGNYGGVVSGTLSISAT